MSRTFCLQNCAWRSSGCAFSTLRLCSRGPPRSFGMILLSGRNCLICRLLPPPDTPSPCQWKLYETRLSQEHIPHKSPGPLVKTFALMNPDRSEKARAFCATGLYPKQRPALPHLAGYLGCHWEAACGFRTIVHCSGQRAAERTARSDGISAALSRQPSRTESPRASRLRPDTRYLSSRWGGGGRAQRELKRRARSFGGIRL